MANPKQIAAMMIALRQKGSIKKLGGLRSVIGQLRKRGHKASDYRGLYHITAKKNVPRIMKRGLLVSKANKSKGIISTIQKKIYSKILDTKAIYALPRQASREYLGDLQFLNKSFKESNPEILKLRVPKDEKITYRPFGYAPEALIHKNVPRHLVRRTKKMKKIPGFFER